VFVKLDQPLRALEYYTKGLDKFPKDKSLLTGMARIHEALNDNEQSINYYKNVLKTDNTSVEAIACIATHHFYGDQPEIALSYYRRLLQMGVYNAELFNNLGLCCYFAQQYDFALTCFQKALALGSSQLLADIWYNIGIIAIVSTSSIITHPHSFVPNIRHHSIQTSFDPFICIIRSSKHLISCTTNYIRHFLHHSGYW
jgi:tetratricopeptide repeat protein 8